jgi:hypothetical protein
MVQLLNIVKQALAFSAKSLQRWDSLTSASLTPERDQADVIPPMEEGQLIAISPQDHPLEELPRTISIGHAREQV